MMVRGQTVINRSRLPSYGVPSQAIADHRSILTWECSPSLVWHSPRCYTWSCDTVQHEPAHLEFRSRSPPGTHPRRPRRRPLSSTPHLLRTRGWLCRYNFQGQLLGSEESFILLPESETRQKARAMGELFFEEAFLRSCWFGISSWLELDVDSLCFLCSF